MSYHWSNFNLRLPTKQGILIKSILTGTVVCFDEYTVTSIEKWMNDPRSVAQPECVSSLLEENSALIVNDDYDECAEWQKRFLITRDSKAHLFTLHFLPTMQCQLNCPYCFEKGIFRDGIMSKETMDSAVKWLDEYCAINSEIDELGIIFFGGEPLLRKNTVKEAAAAFHNLANKRKIDFWTGLTTNGELLDIDTASSLAKHNWKKLQITLDGPQDIHDQRRVGKKLKPTFNKIVANIQAILAGEQIDSVRLNILLDSETAEHIPSLIAYLSQLENKDKLDISLGITSPALGTNMAWASEQFIAEKALAVWSAMQAYGFKIPDEFIVGPWCVAVAKHSALLHPNGSLQKCTGTAGRANFNFGDIHTKPPVCTKDTRYEQLALRVEPCILEKCTYLPVCGGGCIHNSVVALGEKGFSERFCQKTLIDMMNEGLFALNYNSN